MHIFLSLSLSLTHTHTHAHIGLLFLRETQKQNKDWFDGYPISVTTLRWPYFWIHVLVMVNI